MAGFDRNGWQVSAGMGGNFQPESMAGFSRNTQNWEEILSQYADLELDLKDYLYMLRYYIGKNNKTGIINNDIEQCINKLDVLIDMGNSYVSDAHNYQLRGEKDNDLSYLKVQLEKSLKRIDTLIFEEGGVRTLLRKYSSNIKIIIDKAIKQYSDVFESKTITIIRELTDEPCIVFGDAQNLLISCLNILDNIYIHSYANTLKIILNADKDNNYIILEILDDGKGIGSGVEYKTGLSSVEEIITFYNGSFELKNISEYKLISKKGAIYSTKSKIKLPLIQQAKSEVKLNG